MNHYPVISYTCLDGVVRGSSLSLLLHDFVGNVSLIGYALVEGEEEFFEFFFIAFFAVLQVFIHALFAGVAGGEALGHQAIGRQYDGAALGGAEDFDAAATAPVVAWVVGSRWSVVGGWGAHCCMV